MINHSLFNKKSLKLLILPIGIVLRFTFTFPTGFSCLLISIHALGNCSRAILAFLLLWLFSVLSYGIVTEAPLGSASCYLIVVAATAISIVFYSNVPAKRVSLKSRILGIIFLGIFPVVLSFLFISIIGVSLLNVVFFTLVMATLASI